MKILLTVHQFFPEYFSGTEVLTYSVARELIRRSHSVAVLTGFPAQRQMPDENRFDEYDFDGIHVFRFQHSFVPMGGQSVVTEIEHNNLLAACYFAHVLERFAPDVVHFFHMSRLGVGMIDAVLAAGVPAYCTPTDFWLVCPTSQLLLEDGRVCPGPTAAGGNCVRHVASLTRGPRVAAFARRTPVALVDAVTRMAMAGWLPDHQLVSEVAAMGRRRDFNVTRLNALDGIFSPTRLMTRVLTGNGVDAALITQSAYGIEVADYGSRIRERRADAPVQLGFIGTLASHKGCHVLIEALNRLNRPSRLRLRIYGRPEDFPDYYAALQAKASDNQAIEFCGTFPNSRIAEVLDGLDALIVPSLWYENTPLVVYSAQAAYCPVIASNFPGMSEVVCDGDNGLLFAPGDVDGLAKVLARLDDEPKLLQQLSAHCRAPKSSREYVDELLACYGRVRIVRRQPAFTMQEIEPLQLAGTGSFISGWAVADYGTPLSVSVCCEGSETPVGQVRRFLARPDVRDGLRRGGAAVRAVEFGFVVLLPPGLERQQLRLCLEAPGGVHVEGPLAKIVCGSSVQLAPGYLVGLDDEHFSPVAV